MNMVPPTIAPPRRWEVVGPLRGLVCLSILLGHLYGGTLHPRLRVMVGPAIDAAVAWRLGFQCMFVLAGFFLAYSLRQSENHYLSMSRFVSRRVLRLAIPYWAALLLIVLDMWLPNVLLRHSNELPSFWAILSQALFVQDILGFPTMNVIMWSMAALIQYTIGVVTVFWAVRTVALSRRPVTYHQVTERVIQALTVAVFAASLTVVALDVPMRWRLPHSALYLSLGGCVYWVVCGHLSRWVTGLMLALMLLFGGWSVAPRLITGALAAMLLLLMATRTFELPRFRPLGWLSWVGERSYSIYLTHGVIGHRVLNLSNHFPELSSTGVLAFFAVSILASLAFGVVFYQLIERPLMLQSRAVLYRR